MRVEKKKTCFLSIRASKRHTKFKFIGFEIITEIFLPLSNTNLHLFPFTIKKSDAYKFNLIIERRQRPFHVIQEQKLKINPRISSSFLTNNLKEKEKLKHPHLFVTILQVN